jgi:hypothetical protein
MERLFLPCTRLQDILESQGRLEDIRFHHPKLLQERNLNVSTEDVLSAERAFTYAGLYATLGNEETVAWLTLHIAVVRGAGRAMRYLEQLGESYRFIFNADGKVIVALARSPEHLLELCDVLLRLLAVSVVHSVRLTNWRSRDLFINAPTLAYLMEQCQSLKILSLKSLDMDEDIIRVLGAYSRPVLEIVLDCCKITSAGASALVEVLERSQGPTKIDCCYIDNVVLANGLRGNSRLKYLRPRFSSYLEVNRQVVLAVADAVRENKGLVEFDLSHSFCVNDEMWGAICDSLETHPTLEVLDLRAAFMDTAPAPAVLKSRIQTILDMAKVNMSIHTIRLDPRDSQHKLYRGSVIPFLETNRFRPRLFAIQKTRLITYRAKVLGRALLAVRTDPNRLWMLLSGNAEVTFLSTTATTTPAGSLPAPTVSAAPSNAAVDATTAVTATANRSASTISAASTANNVATPTDDHKRQACP